MADAYMRRQHQQQRALAVQVLNAYIEATNASNTQGDAPRQRGERAQNIPPDQLFGDLGAKVKVANG